MKMKTLDWAAMALVIIGGVNWGLIGLAKFDLVAALFGDMTGIARVIYVLVGLSALYMLMLAHKMSK